MIKTIKVKKQLRLDELIKYVWDNNEIFKGRTHIKFTSNSSCTVIFDDSGYFETDYGHDADDAFTVEVEEEVTEDTEFVGIQEIFFNKENEELEVEIHAPLKRKTINDVLEEHDECTECRQIYALINKKLQLIWEAESDGL